MNFGELCQEVITLTGRPDLAADTQLQVRNATTYFHLMDFWQRDLVERQVTFPAAGNQFQFDIPTLFSNWRRFDYIRKWDPVSQCAGDYIKLAAPAHLFDQFKDKKTDIYYTAGTKANVLSSDSQSAFLVGWYTFPDVIQNYQSWIADMIPYAIVEQAAGKIMVVIGKVDEGNKLIDPVKGSVATTQLPLIRANAIVVPEV